MAEPGINVDNGGGKRTGGVVVNQEEIKELQASGAFSSRLMISPRTERPFFYFRYHGESIEGFLGIRHTNTNIRRSASRIIETDHGTEEFFVNQKLAKLIKEYKLEGKYIRITYIGSEFTGFGHARKCYQVEKFAVTDREEKTLQSGAPGSKPTKRKQAKK